MYFVLLTRAVVLSCVLHVLYLGCFRQVVSTSASGWLERPVSEIIYNVLTEPLNPAHSLARSPRVRSISDNRIRPGGSCRGPGSARDRSASLADNAVDWLMDNDSDLHDHLLLRHNSAAVVYWLFLPADGKSCWRGGPVGRTPPCWLGRVGASPGRGEASAVGCIAWLRSQAAAVTSVNLYNSSCIPHHLQACCRSDTAAAAVAATPATIATLHVCLIATPLQTLGTRIWTDQIYAYVH